MTRYQLAIISDGAEGLRDALKQTVTNRLHDLGIGPSRILFLDETTIPTRDRKAPTVAAFIGITEHPVAPASLIQLVRDGVMVVPAVRELSRFQDFVFDELRGINGIELRPDDPNLERLAAVLLEGLSLLRRTRRLFISYRRVETQGIAIQLYELLDQHGFDVFLDTHSIRPGEPFQDVLWHRLADTDVVVLLDSPDFVASRWTEEELARANSTNIQILQVVWPNNRIEAAAAFSRAIHLAETDFAGPEHFGSTARLSDAAAEIVVTEAESLRARALAARYAYLVQEFCSEAQDCGFTPFVQPERFITIEPRAGVFVAAVPAVGVPDAVKYQEIEDEVGKHPSHSELVLLYDERGIREKWLKHLAWLDRQELRVRSLQVAQAATWLRSLA